MEPTPAAENAMRVVRRSRGPRGVSGRRGQLEIPLPTYDAGRQLPLGDVGPVLGDDLPIAQDRHRIGHGEHLLDPVADERQPDPARLDACDQLEHAARFVGLHRGRRLVEDEEAGLQQERAGDLYELALGRTQATGQRGRRDLEAELREQLADAISDGAAVDEPSAATRRAGLHADDVVGDGEVREEVVVLVDHRDPGLERRGRGREAHGMAVEEHLADRRANRAGEHLDERALARAVLPDEGPDAPRSQLGVDVAQDPRRAVCVADADRRQRGGVVVVATVKFDTLN